TWARIAIRRPWEPCRPTSPPWAGRAAGGEGSQEPLQVDAPARREQRLPEIAQLRDPSRNVVHPEILDRDPALQLLPGHRRRNRRAGLRPHGVDGGEGPPPRVLVVVHEDVAPGT